MCGLFRFENYAGLSGFVGVESLEKRFIFKEHHLLLWTKLGYMALKPFIHHYGPFLTP